MMPEPTLTERQLRDLKLEALAEFAAGAGHEINNPSATIVGRAALLLKDETDPERRRALETIGGQAYRVRDMIGDAMTFARPSPPKLEPFFAAVEIERVLETFRDRFERASIVIEKQLDDSLQIEADREQFRVVISCLLKNELEVLSNGSCVRLGLGALPEQASEFVLLTLSDDGPGLSVIEREHLFDPFYSGRQAGRGLGFGLSKCWRIVSLHGGWIDATRSNQSGFSLQCSWPRYLCSVERSESR